MDVIFAIRAGIFFTAGLLVVLFPKQILRWQVKAEKYLIKTFHMNFLRDYAERTEVQRMRTNTVTSIIFFVIAILLLIYSLLN